MVKGFAIHNSMTTHGGIIQATQQRASQMGNLFLRAGDGHYCPQCKCWSTIQPSHNHIIMYGQPVAYVDDLLSCGARILPKQSHVVGDSGSPSYKDMSNSFIGENKLPKNINKISWSYGEELATLNEKSRYYDDLNIHIETTGYLIGESVILTIEPEESDINTFEKFTVSIKIESDGSGIFKNVFHGKKMLIDTEY
ncbi:PAAR domain-containing protein [Acinetobacter sp. WZC-1]|uniref:PAAR domain-containing protein n=1 Tax=Acinetobacter sp. WZC-1 TaxID=3459034 RepID=UPI00403E0D29